MKDVRCKTIKKLIDENKKLEKQIREIKEAEIYYKDTPTLPSKARKINSKVRRIFANKNIENTKQIKANQEEISKLMKQL